MSIVGTIFTTKNLGTKKKAELFFENLALLNYLPNKIGLYDPAKEEFSVNKAIDMWTYGEEGCYVEGIGNTGYFGSVVGKNVKLGFRFDIFWWNSSQKNYMNRIDFYFTNKSFSLNKEKVIQLFKELITISEACYGYISHSDCEDRQHVTGDLTTRLPGVFWCNYFGEKLKDFFEEKKILAYPWYNHEYHGSSGIITYLSKETKELLGSEEPEIQAKTYLGEKSFGDVKQFIENPEMIQQRIVPNFFKE
ncbi:hypothetical protein J6TS2_33060 [Heyndrickxia sporothermodurans]|nr:hypothetical protein J6TS2_33060 [Heyndrickxia sporothermodurans]